MARPRSEWFGCDNDTASRHGISIVGNCWYIIVEGDVYDSCGCTGDGVVSVPFFKDDVTAFNSRT